MKNATTAAAVVFNKKSDTRIADPVGKLQSWQQNSYLKLLQLILILDMISQQLNEELYENKTFDSKYNC